MGDIMGPILEKANLWFDPSKAPRARFSDELKDPVLDRDDISEIALQTSLERGSRLQKLRLRYYPSIDIDYGRMYAGTVDGDLDKAIDKVNRLGYRNNPTAYVEVTEEYGPDDGSYARQIVTETGVRFNRPHISTYPTIFRRQKRQIHITLYETENGTDILAHEERSAWLQPMRHVGMNDSDIRIGVREFREDWYDQFGEELGGKTDVSWEVEV